MVTLPITYYHSHHYKKLTGLTLIEILIALTILSIAMTAIISATAENIRSTHYLQNKTIALWIGQEIMNEARVGLITLPRGTEKLKKMTHQLGQDWYWEANQEETANYRINKVNVQIFSEKNEEASPILSLESYLYRET